MQANYKVMITDHDYFYTKYVTWVSATSKTKAIAQGAALIGGEKTRRDWLRGIGDPFPSSLMDPDITLEPAGFDEYWENKDKVTVEE